MLSYLEKVVINVIVRGLKMRSSHIIRSTLKPMTNVLIRDTQNRDMQRRGGGNVTTETETRVMQPQT